MSWLCLEERGNFSLFCKAIKNLFFLVLFPILFFIAQHWTHGGYFKNCENFSKIVSVLIKNISKCIHDRSFYWFSAIKLIRERCKKEILCAHVIISRRHVGYCCHKLTYIYGEITSSKIYTLIWKLVIGFSYHHRTWLYGIVLSCVTEIKIHQHVFEKILHMVKKNRM